MKLKTTCIQVFLRYWQIDILDRCIEQKITSIISIQCAMRRFFAQQEFHYRRRQMDAQQNTIAQLGEQIMHEGHRVHITMSNCREIDQSNQEHKIKMEVGILK